MVDDTGQLDSSCHVFNCLKLRMSRTDLCLCVFLECLERISASLAMSPKDLPTRTFSVQAEMTASDATGVCCRTDTRARLPNIHTNQRISASPSTYLDQTTCFQKPDAYQSPVRASLPRCLPLSLSASSVSLCLSFCLRLSLSTVCLSVCLSLLPFSSFR